MLRVLRVLDVRLALVRVRDRGRLPPTLTHDDRLVVSDPNLEKRVAVHQNADTSAHEKSM